MPLKDELAKIIQGEVLGDTETLNTYSKDASIFSLTPHVVVFPKDVEDIKKIVGYVNSHLKDFLYITPRSGGTDMSGGAIGESIVLDINKHLNQLKQVSEDSTIVEPGMFYRDFEAETLKQNLILPTYPASREICTVGGMIANNAGGELELTYGPINRYLKSLKMILADGNEYTFRSLTKEGLDNKIAQNDFEGKIYSQLYDLIIENEQLIKDSKPQTSKNSTGYDLWEVWEGETFDLSKLIIGSQGTLGVITEAEFKLIKPKEHQVLVVISLSDLNKLDQIVQKVLESKPEAFECYDDQTLKLALSHGWDLSENFKHSDRLEAFFNLFLDKLSSIVPQLTLLANFTSDDKEEALQRANNAKQALIQLGISAEIKLSEKDQEKYWLIRHKSFGLLRKYSTKGHASPFIDDIIVKPEYLPQFLPKLNEMILPYKDKMVYTFAGHVGDGNFHIIPLMDLSREDVRQIIPELMQKVFDLVFEYKGSMSAEHNDGLIRGPFLPQMYGADIYQLFKKVKEIFDPNNIFNPHKKVDSSFKYSFDHMINS